jgi:hypothetical protein
MNMEMEKASHALTDLKAESQPPPSDELALLETIKVTEEDAAKFPQELVLETRKESPPAERQDLTQWVGKMTVPEKVRLAILGNQEARYLLIHDQNKVIPLAVLRNSKVGEDEIILYAQLRDVVEDLLWAISKHKSWIKNYSVKLALVSNPKTPLALAIKLLDHLHDRDLQNLSRSKNVSSVLSRSAARLLFKRRG